MSWTDRTGAVRLVMITSGLVGLTVVAACGSTSSTTGSLPPIATTTTTTTIVVTTTTVPKYYKVQSGDTLRKIAKSFGVSLKDLKSINGITNADHIEVGQTIRIPPPTSVATALPTTSTTVAPPTS